MEAFESCRIDNRAFHHRDHVRLAWIYLGKLEHRAASDRMAESIRRFALHCHGSLEKYHETVTRSWMALIATALATRGRSGAFDEFLQAHPELQDARALGRYYSAERLTSAPARIWWVEPDLHPLPAPYQ